MKIILTILLICCALILYFQRNILINAIKKDTIKSDLVNKVEEKVIKNNNNLNPLSIEYMREQNYPGSDITFEKNLESGSNYNRYIVSYKSEGNKIFALLTIPTTKKPIDGFPVIIFNHGYIPPKEYKTTEKYVVYQDAFAKNGYITIKSDYRGHGDSEGIATGGYGSPDYTIDILNEISSIKTLKTPDNNELIIDKNKIGMWGHSMGGFITLRSMVISKDIKAGVIWAGVVASYPDLINNWHHKDINPEIPKDTIPTINSWRLQLIKQYGEPSENSEFWKSISANFYLKDISGPILLQQGSADTSVPIDFSKKLENELKEANKSVEFIEYPGDDHNLSNNLYLALERSVIFFDKYLKN